MDEEKHFASPEHALAAGIVMGCLLKAKREPDRLIEHIQPFMDAHGNYTNQILVRIGGNDYTITIDEALLEAMRDD